MTKTQERVLKVLERIRAQVEQDEDATCEYFSALSVVLDDLHSADVFGTEGQNDPRGDFRNGEWSMDRVEGVDQ